KMKKIVLIFMLLFSFSLFAEKPKLAVMNFVDETDGKLSKDLLRNGSKLIRSRFTRNAKKVYEVVTDRENESALATMKKESHRSDRDRDFQIELGKQVSAAKIVMSTIGALDKTTFLITSTLTDVSRGIDETSADATFDGTAKGLMEAVDSIIEQLLEDSGNESADSPRDNGGNGYNSEDGGYGYANVASYRGNSSNGGKTSKGDKSLQHLTIHWAVNSRPQGADCFWRVKSSTPNVKNQNERHLGATPYESTEIFDIKGLTRRNAGDVQIEIRCTKAKYYEQKKVFNMLSVIDEKEISAMFILVKEE
ncbi:hypothetical protein J5834_03935, partial [bacterium]|nr:hypothetical protein [bacterium]